MAWLDADVIVVGAGPAGSAAAAHLARRGIQVMLVDRQAFPRDKTCGDFVGPGALRELEHLGLSKLAAFRRSNRIRSGALFVDGQELITLPLPHVRGLPRFARAIPRALLDDWIRQTAVVAGAEMRQGFRVTRLSSGLQHVTVHGVRDRRPARLRARVVIGADGSTSAVARTLQSSGALARPQIIAVRGYYNDVVGPIHRADLYLNRQSFPGYCWVFVTERGRANVGVGMLVNTIPPAESRMQDLLTHLIESDPALRTRLRHARLDGRLVGWPLMTYDPHKPLVGERCLVIGDAAGLINPLNGEGIQHALQSARWASAVVAHAIATKDCSAVALSAYARRVEREIRGDMAVSTLLVQLIRNRNLLPFWLTGVGVIADIAKNDRQYAAIASAVLCGMLPTRYAGLLIKPTLNRLPQSLARWATDHASREVGGLLGIVVHSLETTLSVRERFSSHPEQLAGWYSDVDAAADEVSYHIANAHRAS